MGSHAARNHSEDKGLGLLWFSVLSGPIAWGLDLLISYALVKPVCFADARFTLTAINGSALVVVIVGALVGRTCLTRIGDARDDGDRPEDWSYFTAVVGVWLNVLIGLLIVFATIPHFVLSPCE